MLAAVSPSITGLGIVTGLDNHLRAAGPDDVRTSVGEETASLGVIRVFSTRHLHERKPPIIFAALIENKPVLPGRHMRPPGVLYEILIHLQIRYRLKRLYFP